MVSVERPPNGLSDLQVNHSSDVFSEKYEILTEIGRGRFAKVCHVREKNSGKGFAAKIIRRWRCGKDTMDNISRELHIIEMGRESPYIVNMHNHFVQNKDVIIVLEHAVGGDLYSLIQFSNVIPSVDSVSSIVAQVLNALIFLHDQRIVHLDVKPDNVLLRQPFPDLNVALCDFGLAKYLDGKTPVRDLVGTPDYAAPEILDYNPISLTTDIWSVGVLTYYLLTGVSPFWAPTKEETCANVSQLHISYPEDLFRSIPSSAIRFIQRTVVKNPRDRPSATECVADLWISDSPVITCTAHCSPVSSTRKSVGTSVDVIGDTTRLDLDRSFGEM